jgi:lipid II:glycine glycyltransferase (peptidoglycan interpeptide bridge formation enzyme)
MITYYRKISFFNVRETWFNYHHKALDIILLNVFKNLKEANVKFIPAVKVISHSVEINLEQDTEIIFANFSSDIRRKIRKAESEGISCYFHNDTDKFVSFYNDFATRKKTFTTSEHKMREFGDYIRMSFAEHNGQVLAGHSYLADKDMKIVTGLHSGTIRLKGDSDKSLVGRAHKLLIVKDILYFKEMGFKTFDFGGYVKDTKDESLRGINNFKLSFGGKVVPCINYYSYGYWLLKKISKLLRLSGKL